MPKKHLVYIGALTALLALAACGNNDNNSDNNGGGDPADMTTDMPAPDMAEDMSAPEDMGPDMPAEGLQIQGLSAPVQVSFDAQRVPHLRCQTNEDCFAAQGYFHAKHRFAQMDLRRRLARGRLTTLLTVATDDAVNADRASRRLLTNRQGEPLEEIVYDGLDAESKALADAYARGVNAFLSDLREGRNGAEAPDEYSFMFINSDVNAIPEWEPQDSVAVGLLFLNNLIDRTSGELRAGERFATQSQTFFLDMYLHPPLDPTATIINSSGESYTGLGSSTDIVPLPTAPDLDPAQLRLQRSKELLSAARRDLNALQEVRGEGPFGSNSWATAPARNSDDWAILSNDPHLPLSNPAIWHLIEMDAKSEGTGDFHAAGVSFAGLPGIMIGYSEEVAWSATVAFWDLSDVYIEELSPDGDGVMLNGNEVPFITKTFEINGEDEEFLYVPHHGPVLEIDRDAGTAITTKSVLADIENDMQLFVNMGRQGSMEQAKDLLATSVASGFNFVLIDRSGNISYYPFAGIPRREWNVGTDPAFLPLDGTGNFEWTDPLIRADELPQLENPTNNFIATSNGAITDELDDSIPGTANTPPLQTPFLAPSVRQARIIDAINEVSEHDWESHLAIQGDHVSWLGQELLPLILAEVQDDDLTAQGRAVRDALTAWDYTCPTGLDGEDPEMAGGVSGDEAAASIGCSAFHATLYTLTVLAFADDFEEEGAGSASGQIEPLFFLLKGDTINSSRDYWDDLTTAPPMVETEQQIITSALNSAAENLEIATGSADADDWRWGRLHTLTLRADLLSGLTDQYNSRTVAAPGGLLTVNVASPRNPTATTPDYSFRAGPSMRMVVEGRPDGMVGRFQLPGGQVHLRDSEFYNSLLSGWLDNEPFVMPFTPDEVDAAAEETVTVSPAPEQ